jgi:hypothetical protein
MKKLLLPVAAGFIFFILSCSGSQITSRWIEKNLQAKKYNKILVLGIMNDNERSLREKMEKHIAGDLKDLGYNAVSAFEEYGPEGFEPNEKEILKKLQNRGVDAVLSIVLLNKTKERYYVPAQVQYTPFAIYNKQFPAYYQTLHNRVFTEGYYAEETRYLWESNFYEAGNRELLYSTQTKSFEASSTETLAHQYGRTIILDMVKHNVLIKPDESSLFEKPVQLKSF